MRTLLLHDITIDQPVADVLSRAGHDVVRCSEPGQPAFPCSGADGSCPLDGSVDVAVVVHDRPSAELAVGEIGVVCALRDGIPVVLAGNHSQSAFASRCDAVAADTQDVPAACERAVAAADRAAGFVSRFCGADAVVVRRGHAVRVQLAPGATERHAVLAHQAVKCLFPTVRTIDVAVEATVADPA